MRRQHGNTSVLHLVLRQWVYLQLQLAPLLKNFTTMLQTCIYTNKLTPQEYIQKGGSAGVEQLNVSRDSKLKLWMRTCSRRIRQRNRQQLMMPSSVPYVWKRSQMATPSPPSTVSIHSTWNASTRGLLIRSLIRELLTHDAHSAEQFWLCQHKPYISPKLQRLTSPHHGMPHLQ